MGDKFDLAIVGSGVAGSLLTVALAESGWLAGNRLALIEADPRALHRRELGYWGLRAIVPGLAERRWDRLMVADEARGLRSVSLRRHRYRRFRGADLAQAAERAIRCSPGSTILHGTARGLGHDGRAARLRIDGRADVLAAGVCDSRGHLLPRPRGPWLSFVGARLGRGAAAALRSAGPLDPRAVLLMDFRIPQRGGVQFVYGIPPDFVEVTRFGAGPQPRELLLADLHRYVAQFGLHCGGGRGRPQTPVEAVVESAHYPLVLRGIRRRAPWHLGIGRRNGVIRPSSGYAVARMAADARTIAATLSGGGQLADVPLGGPRIARWADSVFADVLLRDPAAVRSALVDVLTGDADAVLRFLNGSAGLRDFAATAIHMPKAPFAAAALRRGPRLL